MIVRKALPKDLDVLCGIIENAKAFLKEKGIDQWQKGYPNPEVLLADIEKGAAYVIADENDLPVAYTVLQEESEPTYQKIYDGNWLNESRYITIHRVVVSGAVRGKGYAGVLLRELEKIAKEKGAESVRIDTHKNNLPMQRHLQKNGFTLCGRIYLADGSERIGFEKIL